MRLDTPSGRVWLGYCTNVVPAEDATSLERVIRDLAVPLARRFDATGPFGVGLHITDRTARDLLAAPERLRALRDLLAENGLHPFTVNAFPIGGFHAARVKDAVYRPDWTDPARLEYTLRAAHVHAALLAEGETGTLSTVAGSFDPWGRGEDVEIRVAEGLVRAARALSDLHRETGRRIVLCPEPEPLTTLETTDEVLAFWRNRLPENEPAIRDHLALCFDCCHQAVEHEDLPDSLRRLRDGGVPVGKVQISSALEVDPASDAAIEALRAFDEPRYLHQVVAPDGAGGLARAADLGDVFGDLDAWRGRTPWRVHFHVPIGRESFPTFGTTRAALETALAAIVNGGLCDHLEVETYTWSVLPEEDRPRDLEGLLAGLESELRYAAALIPGRGNTRHEK